MATPVQVELTLSERDQAVLAGIARGLRRRQIGAALGMTERHVQSRQRSMAKRLGLPSSDQGPLIREAYRRGLCDHIPVEPLAAIFLPERQRQILAHMANGTSAADIASELFLSENTLDTHMKLLFRAIGARTRAQAVALDHQHRLRDPAFQLARFRTEYPTRVTRGRYTTVHAWNGTRTACRQKPPAPGDVTAVDAEATCPVCRCSLGLDMLQLTEGQCA